MANVGKGAASGAAIGSAISPGLGTVIGGIGGAKLLSDLHNIYYS